MISTNQCTNFISQDGEKVIQDFPPVGKKSKIENKTCFSHNIIDKLIKFNDKYDARSGSSVSY